MRWDARGHFVEPMQILLATGREARETCPRVLAHELGHVLGLSHVRVGLLSRMQGSIPPTEAFVNDFSPMLTYYDVLALHLLHDAAHADPPPLREVAMIAPVAAAGPLVASIRPTSDQPRYSPAATQPQSARPEAHRPRSARRR
jgi:hypothetical protein